MPSTLDGKLVFWHRNLPPPDAEPIGDHTIEVTSGRVPGTLAHRDELWDRCYQVRPSLLLTSHRTGG
jgi:hypothetical protein